MRGNLARERGFSLMEILVATGLFAIAVTGLVALFPTVQRLSREGEEEARASLIAGNILEALALPSDSGSFQLANGTSAGMLRFEPIDPRANSQHSVAYGSSCEPLVALDREKAELPLTDPGALDIATVRLVTNPLLPGLVVADIEIASPASAPASGRSKHRFMRLFPMPSDHD